MNPKDRKHIGFRDPSERIVECSECDEEHPISDMERHRMGEHR